MQPPAWVFYVVWPVLYLLVGVAGLLHWRASGTDHALIALIVTTLLLQAWWVVFANVCARLLSLATLVVLAAAFVGVAVAMYPDVVAGLCLVPLVAWLSFAVYLVSQ